MFALNTPVRKTISTVGLMCRVATKGVSWVVLCSPMSSAFNRSYQVFSGLVPVASSQGQAEPVCTYMLECCVRPDVEAATVLHVASQVI